MKDMIEELNSRSRERELKKESAHVTNFRVDEGRWTSYGARHKIYFSIDFSKEVLTLKKDKDGDQYCIISTKNNYIIIKKIRKVMEIKESSHYIEQVETMRHFKNIIRQKVSEIEIEFDNIEIIRKKDEYFIWENYEF